MSIFWIGVGWELVMVRESRKEGWMEEDVERKMEVLGWCMLVEVSIRDGLCYVSDIFYTSVTQKYWCLTVVNRDD